MKHNESRIAFNDYKNIIIGAVGLAFATVLLIETQKIRIFALSGVVNAQFFPKIMGWLLIALCMILIVRTTVELCKKLKATAPAVEQEAVKAPADKPETGPQMLTLALLTLYVVLFQPLGFVLSSILYTFAQLTVLTLKENRNYKTIAIVSLVVPVLVYIAFRYGLDVLLPMGVLKFLGV